MRPEERDTTLDVGGYRLGMWSFLGQRFTGLLLTFYLFLHLFIIAQVTRAGGPVTFSALARVLERPPYLYLDLGLVAVVLFHAANGVRLILFELNMAARSQGRLFWWLVGPAGLILLLGGAVLLAGVR